MHRLEVRGHIIWTGDFHSLYEVEPIARDLANAALENKNIHIVIFKKGEKHNKKMEEYILKMNSS